VLPPILMGNMLKEDQVCAAPNSHGEHAQGRPSFEVPKGHLEAVLKRFTRND